MEKLLADGRLKITGPGKARGTLDTAADLGRLSGWDIQFRQLDAGSQETTFRISAGNRVNLMRMRFKCAFHQLAEPPPGAISFGMPIQGMRDWLGRRYETLSIIPFNGASGIDGVSQPGFEAFTMSIAENLITEVADSYRLPAPDNLQTGMTDFIIANSKDTQSVRASIDRMILDDHAILDREFVESIVARLILASLSNQCIADKSSPAARARALVKVCDYIESNKRDLTSVGDICVATGTSWRTLERAFKERFGVGPKAYINALRLTYVRSELSTCAPETRIADVANEWGFWHMGQFARDYRKLFGELPSATLQRKRLPSGGLSDLG